MCNLKSEYPNSLKFWSRGMVFLYKKTTFLYWGGVFLYWGTTFLYKKFKFPVQGNNILVLGNNFLVQENDFLVLGRSFLVQENHSPSPENGTLGEVIGYLSAFYVFTILISDWVHQLIGIGNDGLFSNFVNGKEK